MLLLLKLDIVLRLLLGSIDLVLGVDSQSLHPTGIDAALVRAVGTIVATRSLTHSLVLIGWPH